MAAPMTCPRMDRLLVSAALDAGSRRRADVIAVIGGRDRIAALGGNDIVCGGPGRDRLLGRPQRDRCLGGRARSC